MHPETTPPADPIVTTSSGRADECPPDLRILHYNDVYHVDPSSAEPVGGISRFMTVVREYREDDRYAGQPDLIPVFSGDSFNPSVESTVTKGSFCTGLHGNWLDIAQADG
jgi:5'-nucleotidase